MEEDTTEPLAVSAERGEASNGGDDERPALGFGPELAEKRDERREWRKGGSLHGGGELYTRPRAARSIPTAGGIGRPGELHRAASSRREEEEREFF
jgi:hypothetical protein